MCKSIFFFVTKVIWMNFFLAKSHFEVLEKIKMMIMYFYGMDLYAIGVRL